MVLCTLMDIRNTLRDELIDASLIMEVFLLIVGEGGVFIDVAFNGAKKMHVQLWKRMKNIYERPFGSRAHRTTSGSTNTIPKKSWNIHKCVR